MEIDKYLSNNKLKPKITPSGLLYVVTKASAKNKAQPGDTILINYVTSTLNGDVISSNIESEDKKAEPELLRPEYGPELIIVNQDINTVLDEAFTLMNEGSVTLFIIPSQLAFGAYGFGKLIKPYTTLMVKIELIQIRKLKTSPAWLLTDKQSKPLVYLYIFNQDTRNQTMANTLKSLTALAHYPKIKESKQIRNYASGIKRPLTIWWFDHLTNIVLNP